MAGYWSIWTSLCNTDIKVQQLFKLSFHNINVFDIKLLIYEDLQESWVMIRIKRFGKISIKEQLKPNYNHYIVWIVLLIIEYTFIPVGLLNLGYLWAQRRYVLKAQVQLRVDSKFKLNTISTQFQIILHSILTQFQITLHSILTGKEWIFTRISQKYH